MEKKITFSVPIKKKYDDGKTITCKLRFVDSFSIMLVLHYQTLLITCREFLIV